MGLKNYYPGVFSLNHYKNEVFKTDPGLLLLLSNIFNASFIFLKKFSINLPSYTFSI